MRHLRSRRAKTASHVAPTVQTERSSVVSVVSEEEEEEEEDGATMKRHHLYYRLLD